jgi:hypothetical protein
MSKIIKIFIVFTLFTLVLFTGCTEGAFKEIETDEAGTEADINEDTNKDKQERSINKESIGTVAREELLELVPWEDYSISINIPSGWNIYTGGECSTRSILARDPYSELKQLFYFSEAGPVYTSNKMKEDDKSYMDMGGFDVIWFESPVVDPLTGDNFLINFSALARTTFFQQAFPEVPLLDEVTIISSKSIENNLPYVVDEKLVRAEFKQDSRPGEGYFHIVTANIIGLGYGVMFVGITAPRGLLDLIVPSLLESIRSFEVKRDYVDTCIEAQNRAAAGALEAGRILGSSSDTIMEVWESKLKSEQRMSEKYSDAIMGQSRLYNPETDEVYEITPEFYEYYKNYSSEFEINYLQEMPDDKWGYPPLNGAEYIY